MLTLTDRLLSAFRRSNNLDELWISIGHCCVTAEPFNRLRGVRPYGSSSYVFDVVGGHLVVTKTSRGLAIANSLVPPVADLLRSHGVTPCDSFMHISQTDLYSLITKLTVTHGYKELNSD